MNSSSCRVRGAGEDSHPRPGPVAVLGLGHGGYRADLGERLAC